ncbi:MAG: hypothetical protein V2A54_12990, partial [Bacteroidota bacterium]
MKRIFIFVGISLIFMALLQSCLYCSTHEEGRNKLTQADLNMVPYHGSENLVFIDSLNDSLNFIYTGRNGKMKQENLDIFTCPNDYYVTESDITKFISSNNDIISFELGFFKPWSDKTNKFISIS